MGVTILKHFYTNLKNSSVCRMFCCGKILSQFVSMMIQTGQKGVILRFFVPRFQLFCQITQYVNVINLLGGLRSLFFPNLCRAKLFIICSTEM